MLARPHGLRLDHNRENPTAGPHHHAPLPSKTPARAGKAAAPVTGGKAQLTARAGRVLARKDGNTNQRDGNEPAGLLFPTKPSTSQAGPSSCAPQFRTPGPRKTLRPSAEMCTPATGVRPRHAPPLMLSEQSPDVSMEMDEGPERREIDLEAEVEYAGPSASDFDEPFVPEHAEPDYKTAGFGASLRGMSLGRQESAAEWAERDETERKDVRIELDDELAGGVAKTSPTSQPLFPLPPKQRSILSAKSSNLSSTSSLVPAGSAAARKRVLTPLSSTATSSLRKPLASTSSQSSLRRAPPSLAPASSTKRPAIVSASSSRLNPSVRPASSLASSKPSLSSASSISLRKPVPSSSSRPPSSASSSTLARPRPLPAPLSFATTSSRPGSSASIHSASSKVPASVSAASATSEQIRRREAEQQQERELGIFGVVDGEEELGDMLDFGDGTEGMEEAFKFELEL